MQSPRTSHNSDTQRWAHMRINMSTHTYSSHPEAKVKNESDDFDSDSDIVALVAIENGKRVVVDGEENWKNEKRKKKKNVKLIFNDFHLPWHSVLFFSSLFQQTVATFIINVRLLFSRAFCFSMRLWIIHHIVQRIFQVNFRRAKKETKWQKIDENKNRNWDYGFSFVLSRRGMKRAYKRCSRFELKRRKNIEQIRLHLISRASLGLIFPLKTKTIPWILSTKWKKNYSK